MEVIKIEGGHTLSGSIRISGAKNSAVALIPAAILGNEPLIIDDAPDIADVGVISALIEELGAKVIITKEGNIHKVNIDPSKVQNRALIEGNVRKMRASYYLMGAMLGKFGEATLGIPGGCYLGPRPIDLHLKGFKALGAEVHEKGDVIELRTGPKGLCGTTIYLDFPSVGATINIMLAAVRAKGKTIIENAAKEPEIIDVATFLNNMGAKIKGVGTDIITIEGVTYLGGCYHQIIPDRIQAGTYTVIGALAAKDLVVENIIPEHMEAVVSKMHEMGINIELLEEKLVLKGEPLFKEHSKLKSADITTQVFPGFATDIQQPFSVLLTLAHGKSHIKDTIYPERFRNCEYLNTMGATISIEYDEGEATFEGPTKLTGREVYATDLRGGVSMIAAGLIAEGVTTIKDIYHIERGYEEIIEKLQAVGARIWKEVIPDEPNITNE